MVELYSSSNFTVANYISIKLLIPGPLSVYWYLGFFDNPSCDSIANPGCESLVCHSHSQKLFSCRAWQIVASHRAHSVTGRACSFPHRAEMYLFVASAFWCIVQDKLFLPFSENPPIWRPLCVLLSLIGVIPSSSSCCWPSGLPAVSRARFYIQHPELNWVRQVQFSRLVHPLVSLMPA